MVHGYTALQHKKETPFLLVGLLVLKLSSWMCILDPVVHYKRSHCLCIHHMCVFGLQSADDPVSSSLSHPQYSWMVSLWGGVQQQQQIWPVAPHCSPFFLSYFIWWNTALDATWLHAGISEREDTWTREEGFCPLLATRGLFSFIHWFLCLFLTQRAALWLSNTLSDV